MKDDFVTMQVELDSNLLNLLRNQIQDKNISVEEYIELFLEEVNIESFFDEI